MNERRSRNNSLLHGRHSSVDDLERSGNLSTISENRPVCLGLISPVRRTFCLLATFDLILTFLLWALYTQIAGMKPFPKKAFEDEIFNYEFKKSMFDMIIISSGRFLVLLIFYLLFRLRNPSVVAISTTVTTIFLITKIFMFNFEGKKENIITYILLVSSFIISWVEVWFLDFNVLPREEKSRYKNSLLNAVDERSPLLQRYLRATANYEASCDFQSCRDWYSPEGSEAGSDDDLNLYASSLTNKEEINEAHMFTNKAKDAWDRCYALCCDTIKEWKLEGKNENAQVFSIVLPGLGKFYRLETEFAVDINTAYEALVLKFESLPQWNKEILKAEVIKKLSEFCDIIYTLSAPAAGGVVSSRDFVSVRFTKNKEKIRLSCATAIEYDKVPKNRIYVRGSNNLAGHMFIPKNFNRTKFIWLLNCDLGGFIPKFTVNRALCGVMLDAIPLYQQHLNSLANKDIYLD